MQRFSVRRSRIWHTLLLLFFLLLLLFLDGTRSLHAQIDTGDPGPVTMELPLELYVDNGRQTTKHMVAARVSNLTRVDSLSGTELSEAIAPSITPGLRDRLSDVSWWTPEELVLLGLSTEYDPGALSAHVYVPPSLQPTERIALRGGGTLPEFPLQPPAKISASLPLYFSGEQEQGPGEGISSYALEAMPGVNLGGWLLEGELRALGSSRSSPELQNWEARIVRDIPEHQLRWTAGHLTMESRGFQGGVEILGTALEKRSDVGFGNNGSTRYLRRFEVSSTSEVEVYVNRRLVRTMTLEPGSYELSEFPLLPGTNEVEIRLTDQYGQSRSLNGSVSYAGELLERGQSAFGVAAGVAASAIDEPGQFESPLGRGFLRYGVGESVTLGVHGEGDEITQLAGGEMLLAGFLGVYELTGAGSFERDGGSGYAGRLNYTLPTPRRHWLPNLGVQVEYRSPEFAPVGGDSAGKGSWIVGGSINQSLPFRSSLLVGGTHRFYDTGERSTSLFAGFGKQIGGSTSLRVSGSRLYEGDQESWGVQISLVSRPFGGRGSYGTTYDARREELDLAGAYGLEGRRADGTIGVKAQGLDTESYEPRSVSGSFQGSLPQAEGYFAATSTTVGGGISGAPESVRLTGQVGTGLYFADGLLGFGRPSTDSFVLVGKSRTLAGGEILVNPTDRGAEARSGIIGAATLPSVGEYRAKPIRAEVSGVPVDYALGPTAYIVESGHRTGTAIRITGSKLLYGTGRLLDETGAPVALQVFEVRRKDQRVLSSFTDEEGRFLLYDLEPGEYTLAVPGLRKVEAMLRLSEDRVSPFDVGELYLQEERGK